MEVSKKATQNGLFMGLMLVICSFTIYKTDPASFISFKSWILFMPFLILLVKSGLDARRENGGIISFGQAFKDMLTAAVIGVFICTLFEYILFNYIDTDLKDLMMEISLISLEQMKGIISESYVETLIERMEQEDIYSFPYTLSTFLTRILSPCILFSLLIAFIIKRKKDIKTT